MDLSIMKSVFPNFQISDFHMFDEIISLKWENMLDDETYEEYKYLTLEMTSLQHYKITLECKNVTSFRFQSNSQILGFYIKDMSTMGYENNSKYEVGDYEEEGIEFYCSDIVIKSLEKYGTEI